MDDTKDQFLFDDVSSGANTSIDTFLKAQIEFDS